ncbi:MAG: DUF2225 domain-containing protein [Candidatus Heimdallarchaeota archaeon]|nr:DUF2225 domain-containing protein [Candidatus Heimdallarchaeota archaeon]
MLMTLLFEELFSCPICDTKFMSKVLGVYNTFGPRYSDLYTCSEENPQPILHQIHLCPKCGFGGYKSNFQNFTFEIDEVKECIKKVEILTEKNVTEFNVGDGFLEIAYYQQNTLEEQALLKLQASYAYRELKDSNVVLARRLVIKDIEQILEQQSFRENPKEMYLYLIGELHRLLENQEEAQHYFEQILTEENNNSYFAFLAKKQLNHPEKIVPKKAPPT